MPADEPKVIYDKRGPVAHIRLNRPEVKNAIDVETHELLRDIWRDFGADPDLRVAVLTGTGDAFCAGADLKTHVPEWDDVGPMLARNKLPDGFAGGITRGQHRIYKPVVAALNGWVLGGGLELALACDIRIASERAVFGSFELRRGMHPADGGIVRLVNICGAGIALEMELTGEPIDAQRALQVNMVSRVVPHADLATVTDDLVAKILRNDRQAVESAKETILEVIGRPLDDQLKLEALLGYAICGDNPAIRERSEAFFDKTDEGRVGATPRPSPAPGGPAMIGHRPVYDTDQQLFRQSARRFVAEEIAPHFEAWEQAQIVDRDLWLRAGKAGMLCPQVPEEYGGTGDFRYNAVLIEECSYAGFAGPTGNFTAHSDVACGYVVDFAGDELRSTWLPRMLTGEAVCSIAMSEPAAGSDLQGLRTRAVRDGDDWIINGQKTFISNGQHCDISVVVARTDPDPAGRAMSLFLVEADRPGFTRGRNLDKLGHHSADTSELSFVDVRVPAGNLLGTEGRAMSHLMHELPQERLIIAVASIAAAQKAFDLTRTYVAERTAFGTTVGAMQHTRFALADLAADLAVGWAYVDACLGELVAGTLTTERASIAKLWVTEMQGRLVDRCVQFFGGYGFMREYEICRLYADARIQRIYGGTSEIMREIIARSL